jgi:ankyrin repeat and BTB/POZ domain-containing protein 1
MFHKASLCGHYEVVQLLLESGALCERDTFQGERCLYNALNDRIRNLLLSYDYSKSTDPLQPLAGHVASLLGREHPKTWDLTLTCGTESLRLHKFVLAARSPYFSQKLATAPETTSWRLPNTVPSDSLRAVIRFIYMAEISTDFGDEAQEQGALRGIDKLSRQLEVERLFDPMIIDSGDRRVNRQRRTDEVSRGREELERWFRNNIVKHKVHIETSKADTVKWDRTNGIYADVLLRADEDLEEDDEEAELPPQQPPVRRTEGPLNGIPIGPFAQDSASRSHSRTRQSSRKPRKSVLFPAHRAMLLRSEFFSTMFSSSFREAQETEYLQIIPIDCSPAVLEVVLSYLYTESCSFGLDIAIDVLFAADLLFIDKLKVKAATTIATLGNGTTSIVEADGRGKTDEEELIDVFDVMRAGWITRMHRLEEFCARYIAYRLERYIDQEEFVELVRESASRIKERQETDTIELIDEYVIPSPSILQRSNKELTEPQYTLLPLRTLQTTLRRSRSRRDDGRRNTHTPNNQR